MAQTDAEITRLWIHIGKSYCQFGGKCCRNHVILNRRTVECLLLLACAPKRTVSNRPISQGLPFVDLPDYRSIHDQAAHHSGASSRTGPKDGRDAGSEEHQIEIKSHMRR